MSSEIVLKPTGPDIGLIGWDDGPFRPFPLDRKMRRKGFQVVMKRSVIEDMRRYGLDNPDFEVCGVLVGNVYRDEQGPYLYAAGGIRGEHAGHDKTQVTFTGETWTYIQDEMESRYPEDRMIGWYHTHPGFGVFLSSMDRFIHNHFFNLSWQVAWVYDPFADEAGLYVWKNGRAVLEQVCIEEDGPGWTSYDAPVMRLEERRATAGAGETGALQARVARLEGSLRLLKWLVAALALLALLWPIGAVMIFRGADRPPRPFNPPGLHQPGTSEPRPPRPDHRPDGQTGSPGKNDPEQADKATPL